MIPERVEAIAVVSGAPPIAELQDRSGVLTLYNRLLALRGSRPGLLRALFHIARPFASVKLPIRVRPLLLKILQPCDANVLRDSKSFEACFESARQAWRSSAVGVMTDAEIYAKPWGFPLEEVRVPVRLWHGKKTAPSPSGSRSKSRRVSRIANSTWPTTLVTTHCQSATRMKFSPISLSSTGISALSGGRASCPSTAEQANACLPHRQDACATPNGGSTSANYSRALLPRSAETLKWKISWQARCTINPRDGNQRSIRSLTRACGSSWLIGARKNLQS